MSLDSAKDFCQKAMADENFAKKLANYPSIGDFCKAEGYDFTQEELAAAKKELTKEEIDNLHCHTEACNWLGG